MPEHHSAEARGRRGRNRWLGVLLILFSPLLALLVLIVGASWVVGALALHLLTLICWVPVGRRVLFVYSDSPQWKVHVETEVLPRLPSSAAVLNWSERSRWPRWNLAVW